VLNTSVEVKTFFKHPVENAGETAKSQTAARNRVVQMFLLLRRNFRKFCRQSFIIKCREIAQKQHRIFGYAKTSILKFEKDD